MIFLELPSIPLLAHRATVRPLPSRLSPRGYACLGSIRQSFRETAASARLSDGGGFLLCVPQRRSACRRNPRSEFWTNVRSARVVTTGSPACQLCSGPHIDGRQHVVYCAPPAPIANVRLRSVTRVISLSMSSLTITSCPLTN